jgi:hypothetical protein
VQLSRPGVLRAQLFGQLSARRCHALKQTKRPSSWKS